MDDVSQQRAIEAQCTHPFGERLRIHQHPANIRVDEQRVGFFVQILRARERSALTAFEALLGAWCGLRFGELAELRRRLPASFRRTTWEVLSELTSDPELIAVLTGQWGDLGLPPKRSSFVVQALIASGGPAVIHVDVDPVKHMWAPGLIHFKKMHEEPKA